MAKDDKKLSGGLQALVVAALIPGLIMVTFALSLFGGIVQAFVLDHFWAWFIEPLGVRGITFAEALGICLVVALLLNRPRPEMEKPWKAWVSHILAYPLLLLFGYIVHLIIG